MSTRKNEREKNEKIRQLREILGLTEAQARILLTQNDWDLQRAINSHYENSNLQDHSTSTGSRSNYSSQTSVSGSNSGRFDRKKIEQLWSNYCDPHDQSKTSIEQLICLLKDLNFDPGNKFRSFKKKEQIIPFSHILVDRETLVLCWKLNCETQGEIKKQEFLNGMNELQCDTLDKLREKIRQINREIDYDNEKFKQLYLYTFNFGRSSTQKKNLDRIPGIQRP
ncbi:unnamed protein product [Didymodactylos carnosus]|uniref:Defective in cullin neddylation protein n=1 Tax=Didymodactylos carnosus TaxID=1234261 RepID=A0A813SHY1_9BILA|nr:unnamed protein product [Didymodactylos carnosus]CAF3579892.1 unnamed protein product [Didymodactylos carnosus]